MKIENQIIITDKGIEVKGFNTMEVLGLLRYYEKIIWLQMVKKQEKSTTK